MGLWIQGFGFRVFHCNEDGMLVCYNDNIGTMISGTWEY